ncbi:MAG: aminomethyl transferase family protein [Chloroflexi bacterium]|nr:aminomethyl transferase family protein [Chloroflexota bacterium]
MPQQSVLVEHHRRAGAQLQEVDGWLIPTAFAPLFLEYEAATQRVALVDRSPIGRLVAGGADALDLLNRLSTNRVEGLGPGQGTATVLTTNKGRVVDRLVALRRNDDILLLTGAQARGPVMQWIAKYTITEDASLRDVTQETAMIGLLGPRAAVVEKVLGAKVSALPPYGSLETTWDGVALTVARTDPLRSLGYDLILPLAQAEALWESLRKAGDPHGMLPLGETAWEALRVAACVPRHGRELTEAFNPLEANLQEDISFAKGCYIGQEVVARLNTYRKVQRYLVRLWLERPVPPGSRLRVQGQDAGQVTSVAPTPQGGTAALAYLRTRYVHPATRVDVPLADGSTVAGQVSWAPEVPPPDESPLAKLMAELEEEEAQA